jgi:hypothetical protein
MMYASDQMMKEGLNSRADKTRQDALRQKEAEERERQAKAAEELARSKFEFDKEQMSHWSKNPEFSQLATRQRWNKERINSLQNSINFETNQSIKDGYKAEQDALKADTERILRRYREMSVPESLWEAADAATDPQQAELPAEKKPLRDFASAKEKNDFAKSFTVNSYDDLPDAYDVIAAAEARGNSISAKEAEEIAERISKRFTGKSSYQHEAAMRALALEEAKRGAAKGRMADDEYAASRDLLIETIWGNPTLEKDGALIAQLDRVYKDKMDKMKIGPNAAGVFEFMTGQQKAEAEREFNAAITRLRKIHKNPKEPEKEEAAGQEGTASGGKFDKFKKK